MSQIYVPGFESYAFYASEWGRECPQLHYGTQLIEYVYPEFVRSFSGRRLPAIRQVVKEEERERSPDEEIRDYQRVFGDGAMPVCIRRRISELRRVIRKRDDVFAKQNYLIDPRTPIGHWTGMYGRSDIPKGVARPTSVKQFKRKNSISESTKNLLSEDEFKAKSWPDLTRFMPRQARFDKVMNYLTRAVKVKVGVLGQKGTDAYRVSSLNAALTEGLMRAKIGIMAKYNPNLLDSLEQLVEPECDIAEPNMETAHGDSDLSTDKAGNVALQKPVQISKTQPQVPSQQGFLNLSSATEKQTFEQITDRWLNYEVDIDWGVKDELGKDLMKLKLPWDFLRTNQNSPNVAPFVMHKFARFDMRVMAIINSNTFQAGQLQISWMYNSHINTFNDHYDNIYSASQRMHTIISAGSSNSAELAIPYWALTSSVNLKNNSDEKDQGVVALTLGELSVKVLSPLVAPETVSQFAHVKILLKFEKPEFRALCDRSINSPFGTPNMEEIVNTMEPVLHIANRVLNMDNPLKPEIAMTVQPQASHSFGTMKRQNEILRSLRADPLAQTPPMIRGDGREATIRNLLNKWSLVTSFNWKASDKTGASLLVMDSSPIWPKKSYKSTGVAHQFYHLPIIAIISSFFMYWRGDIEIRLDFVATKYHSGSIAIATIPGAEGNETFDVAKSSAYQVFSLMETHQCIYKIPYYNNVPVHRTKHNLDRSRDVIPPSKTMIYVYNPLSLPATVAQSINVNVYIRGASNFEVCVPKTISLALSFNTDIKFPTSTSAWVDPGWSQMFTAGSRWTNNYLCFFYNQTTDYFTEFLNLNFGKVYVVPTSTTELVVDGNKVNFKVEYVRADGTNAEVTHMVRCSQYDGYPVACCFNDPVKAINYAKSPRQHVLEANGLKAAAQGPWAQIRPVGGSWRAITANELSKIPFELAPEIMLNDWVAVPNMEDGATQVATTISLDKPAPKSGAGMVMFGENVTSLTELCKRWHRCGCGYFVPSTNKFTCLSQAVCVCRIATHPLRRFTVANSKDADNRLRDGVISLCTSGFAGYRGSMRYRIVFNSGMSKTISFSVVHRFDKRVNVELPTVQVMEQPNREAADYFDTAYAAELQSTVVNNVLEFEIPFYNRGEYNSCYLANADAVYILDNYQMSGEIRVYVSGMSKEAIGFDVYYSIGDDFAFSNFQGFPQMFFLDEIPAEPNVDVSPTLVQDLRYEPIVDGNGVLDLYKEDDSFDFDDFVNNIGEPNMEYITSFFTFPKKLGDACSVVTQSMGTLGSKVVDSVQSLTSVVKSVAVDTFNKIPSFTDLLKQCGGFAHTLLTQLLHILCKPYCKMTIAIAIFSILCATLSDKICSLFSNFKDVIGSCFNWLFGKNKQNTAEQNAVPNAEDTDAQATFLSLLWSIVATIAGYIGNAPKSMAFFVKDLFKNSSNTFRTHVFGVKFFKDFLELLKRMWQWINVKLGLQKPLYKLTSNDKFLQEWALTSAVVLAPENRDLVITSKEWISKLFEVQIVGRLIKQAAIASDKHITRDLFNMICDTQKKLTERVDELIKRKCYVPIRQEPFIVWFVGDPGVGKTHISQVFMRKLAADYKISPDIFSLVAGQKYYDLLQYQKFVLLDDFLNWTGESAEEVFGQYLQMAGTNMLSLPRAVAQDKAVLDNFEFLFVTSNQMFFDLLPGIRCPEAYNRRRHLTIEVKMRPEFVKGYLNEAAAAQAYRKLPDCDKDNCKNIMFLIHENDDKKHSKVAYTFDELYTYIKMSADAQRENASVKYFKMVKEHMEALEKCATDVSSFGEFFEKMKLLTETASQGDMERGLSEAGNKCVVWISERLKARYAVYEDKPSSSLPQVDEINKEVKAKIDTKIEAKPSTSAEPNGPGDFEIKAGSFDEGIDALLSIANKATDEFVKRRDRFDPPINGIYSLHDVPLLACEQSPKLREMAGVFNDQDFCAHRHFKFQDAYFYRFSDATRELVKTTYKVNPSPEGIFIDPSGMNCNFVANDSMYESYACFSTACTLHDGSIDPSCVWTDHSTYSNDLAVYWNSLAGVLHFKLPKYSDFVALGEDNLQTLMPLDLLRKVKKIYDKDAKFLLKSNKGIIANVIHTVQNGFMADRVVVDGVNHGVYPSRREVDNEVRDGEVKIISRSKGLLYDNVQYYKSGNINTKKEPSTITSILVTIGIVIAMLSGLISFVNLILCFLEYWGVFSLWEWNKGGISPQVSTSGDFKMTKQAAKGTVKAVKLLSGTGNSGENPNEDGRLKKIISNVFWILAKKDVEVKNGEIKNKVIKARCMGLYGYKALVLTHYIEMFAKLAETDPDYTFWIMRKDSKTLEPCDFSKFKFEYPDQGGYCVMEFPVGGIQFKDIRKYMPNEGIPRYSSKATLIEVHADCIEKTNLDVELTYRKQIILPDPDSGMSPWELTQKFQYKGKAGKGLCGSFLFDAASSTPLIGIHTSGVKTELGFSELLLRNTFQSKKDEYVVEFVTPNLSIDVSEFQPAGPHVAVGHVSKKEGVIVPNKTRIIPSKAFGIFETHTEPAPLHPSDPRLPPDCSPLELGVEKRCDLVKPFLSKDIKTACEDVENMLMANCKPVRAVVEPLSVKQAIEGIKGIRGMEPMELKTSEGYPWTKYRPKGFTDKRWMFNMKETNEWNECEGINPRLSDELDAKDKMRANRIVPATYFTACLKDARIAKEKVSVPGKTRLFEMSPVDLTIAQRRYFLDFYASYMNCRRDCENTIGINVNSSEWSCLAEDLVSFSENILGGDYSSYGPRMSLEILHNVWDIIVKWMIAHMPHPTVEIVNNMKTMKFECLNSLLIVGRYVMRCMGGMHSGNVATVILNSLCNSVLVRIAFLGIMRKDYPAYASIVYFKKFVKMYSNGDDLIIAVKDEIIKYFNNQSISDFFAVYGLKYTNSKKDQAIVPYEDIFSVSYLKSVFVPHPFRKYVWTAALDIKSIEDTPQWIWNKDCDPWEATIQNCDQAIRLCYGHGPKEFNRVRSVILKFLQENGKYMVFPTWDELDESVWDMNLEIVFF